MQFIQFPEVLDKYQVCFALFIRQLYAKINQHYVSFLVYTLETDIVFLRLKFSHFNVNQRYFKIQIYQDKKVKFQIPKNPLQTQTFFISVNSQHE